MHERPRGKRGGYNEEGAHMHGGDRRRQGKGMTGHSKEEPRVK